MTASITSGWWSTMESHQRELLDRYDVVLIDRRG